MKTIKGIILFLALLIYQTVLNSQQGSGKFCIDAEPLCGSNQFSYSNTLGFTLAENGPDYGCLVLALNPSWFYLQIAQDGDINLQIEESTTVGGVPDLDVDFIIYGPFNDPRSPCISDLQIPNIVDCSFETDFVEFIDIPNTKAGEYYLLLITNFSRDNGYITVTQMSGAATTNCNVLNNTIESTKMACEGEINTLDATTNNANQYIWYEEDGFGNFNRVFGVDTATYNVTISGVYRAEAFDSNNVFLDRYEFNVTFYPPPVISAEVKSKAFIQDNDIRVTATGLWLQEPEFSIDGNPWQESNVFKNVSMGEHIITVRNAVGCGQTSLTIMVMDYPLYFTPNGDGVNDTWNIDGLKNQYQASIYIYDRYGKFIKQLKPNGQGWDGTFNGVKMPSNDYWFTISYLEPRDNSMKTFKAHFALKR